MDSIIWEVVLTVVSTKNLNGSLFSNNLVSNSKRCNYASNCTVKEKHTMLDEVECSLVTESGSNFKLSKCGALYTHDCTLLETIVHSGEECANVVGSKTHIITDR